MNFSDGAMKHYRSRKIVLLAAVLMLGVALAPYAHAMGSHHHSMGMVDCSASMDCLACANSLPTSTRNEYLLSPSLDAASSFLIPEVVGPAVSHYHPPG